MKLKEILTKLDKDAVCFRCGTKLLIGEDVAAIPRWGTFCKKCAKALLSDPEYGIDIVKIWEETYHRQSGI